MRVAAGALLILVLGTCSGCIVAGATIAAVGAVTAVSVKTASKVTVATVGTTGRLAAAAITSSGEVTALSLESAAKLARAGMVVAVDAGNGAVVELPWQEGMQLYQAAQSGQLSGSFNAAKIFRDGRMLSADLKKADTARQALRAGDVIELRH